MRLLGRGQHGAAVLLRSPDGGDVVVAKQVATEGLGPSELEKVESEVRILQRFSHANVVSYFCCFLHEETLSIVLEYCDGGTLAEAMRARRAQRALRHALVATWAKQLGGAVQHVHAHRVLHRDIKTANVFLTAQRQIKLGDFGISRVMGTHTNLAETVCGTPYYLSPELVMGQPYNQPADAWAIGVILYELLTLKRPFTGPNIAALVLKITRCDYDRAALGDSPTLRSCIPRDERRTPRRRPRQTTHPRCAARHARRRRRRRHRAAAAGRRREPKLVREPLAPPLLGPRAPPRRRRRRRRRRTRRRRDHVDRRRVAAADRAARAARGGRRAGGGAAVARVRGGAPPPRAARGGDHVGRRRDRRRHARRRRAARRRARRRAHRRRPPRHSPRRQPPPRPPRRLR